MTTRRAFLALSIALAWPARAQTAIEAMPFSSLKAGAPLPEWLRPFAFEGRPRHTEFALVADEGRTVLRARAEASTSGLVRELRVDLRSHPILAWRWKAANLLAKSDLATKDGDDFPVRLYVTFDLDAAQLSLGERAQLALARMIYGASTPVAALCYVWDGRVGVGTIVPNAYTDRVRMVVAESGPAHLGRWRTYERNVADDFRRAFGLEPPAVNALIVSADTDNTGERAESWFGDIAFRARPSF